VGSPAPAVGAAHQMLPIGKMLLIRQMLLIGKMLPIGQMLLIGRMLLILPAPAVGAAPHDILFSTYVVFIIVSFSYLYLHSRNLYK
jgi:hypothetical protein